MTPHDLQHAEFRLRLGTSEEAIELTPGEPSSKLDELLEKHSAETLVFMPLRKPRKKPKAPLSSKTLKKRRAKLKAGEWHEGELVRKEPAPAVAAWRFDLPRAEARSIAEELGLEEFYWACAGSTVEAHPAEMFSCDDAFDLDQIRVRSREGLKDMLHTALEMSCLAKAARAAGSTLTRFRWTAALVLFVASAVSTLTLAPSPWYSVEELPRLADILIHPVLIPTVLFGIYLRRNLIPSTEDSASTRIRELDRKEGATKWAEVAPHELAVWIVLATCVSLLTLTHLLVTGELTAIRFVEDLVPGILVALWLLTPIAYSPDLSSVVGGCIEAVINLALAIFTIKLTLALTNFMAGLLWGVLTTLIPIEFAEWIKEPFEAITTIMAELLLGALFVGYRWSKAQEYHGRWATMQVSKGA